MLADEQTGQRLLQMGDFEIQVEIVVTEVRFGTSFETYCLWLEIRSQGLFAYLTRRYGPLAAPAA